MASHALAIGLFDSTGEPDFAELIGQLLQSAYLVGEAPGGERVYARDDTSGSRVTSPSRAMAGHVLRAVLPPRHSTGRHGWCVASRSTHANERPGRVGRDAPPPPAADGLRPPHRLRSAVKIFGSRRCSSLGSRRPIRSSSRIKRDSTTARLQRKSRQFAVEVCVGRTPRSDGSKSPCPSTSSRMYSVS